MTSVDRVKDLLKEKGIPVSRMEKDLGFANGYIGQLKKGTLPADRLDAIAEYLGVDRQFLIWGKVPENVSIDDGNGWDDDLLEFEEELQIMKDDPETRSLLRSTKGLTAEQIRAVKYIVKNMRRGSE